VSTENKKIVENIESLLVNGATTEHCVSVEADSVIKVWVKELTFLESQGAVKEFMDINPTTGEMSMDLGAYWKYMLMQCVEKTEPKMSKAQILSLKPYILNEITTLLPQPQDIVAGPLGGLPE